jgi:hypothetical protein
MGSAGFNRLLGWYRLEGNWYYPQKDVGRDGFEPSISAL